MKFIHELFGGREWVFRLLPLLCGCMSLVVLAKILIKVNLKTIAWFPVLLMGIGEIYIRYATEVKQYSGDVLVTECLLLAYLNCKSLSTISYKSVVLWIIGGGISILLSMPSVFILAGIGCAWIVDYFNSKKYIAICLYLLILVNYLYRLFHFSFTPFNINRVFTELA